MADLNDHNRKWIEDDMSDIVGLLAGRGQSLAIARQAMINAFDEAAEKL